MEADWPVWQHRNLRHSPAVLFQYHKEHLGEFYEMLLQELLKNFTLCFVCCVSASSNGSEKDH